MATGNPGRSVTCYHFAITLSQSSMPQALLATSFGDADLEFLVGVVLFGGEVEGHGGPPVFLVAESSR